MQDRARQAEDALRQKLDRYFVGSASGDGMGYFEGNIAEVRVWNLPRPEEEIQAEPVDWRGSLNKRLQRN